MSGQYFEAPVSSEEQQFYDFIHLLNVPQTTHATGSGSIFVPHLYESLADQHGQIYNAYPQFCQQQPPPAQQYHLQIPVPEQQQDQRHQSVSAHLFPEMNSTRASRAPSVAESIASSVLSSQPDFSRDASSPSASEMSKWARRNSEGTWSCAYPGCASKTRFKRGCDVRKHYKRHTKSVYCRHEGCPQARAGGFSSKKDRARHEAKHNPVIECEWEGCGRVFSRQDNMKDHVRRLHQRRRSHDVELCLGDI